MNGKANFLGSGMRYFAIALVVGNRLVAKIGFGPFYFLDMLLGVMLLAKSRSFLFYVSKFWSVVLFFVMGVLWLLVDFWNYGFDIIYLRRFAFALYIFVPIFFLIYGRAIYPLFFENGVLISLIILLLYVLMPDGFTPTVGAQVIGFILLYYVFVRGVIDFKLAVVSVSWLFVSSGALGQGLYKTPMLGMALALAFSFLYLFWKFFFYRYSFRMEYVRYFHVLFLIVLLSSLLGVFNTFIAEALYALSGLSGIEYFRDIAAVISDSQIRERGSSHDTAETRVFFWKGIFSYAWEDGIAFWVGHGYGLSFLDRVFPTIDFIDTHLVEPHNSFVGCFYRYGLLGLILLIYIISSLLLRVSRSGNYLFAISTIVLSIVYANFEVVLESPHGAFIFWFILMSSKFVKSENTDFQRGSGESSDIA